MTDKESHVSPGLGSIEDVTAEVTHDFGVCAHLRIWLEVAFAPHAKYESVSFQLNFLHGRNFRFESAWIIRATLYWDRGRLARNEREARTIRYGVERLARSARPRRVSGRAARGPSKELRLKNAG